MSRLHTMEQSEYYALRVALQTMKERCVSLQKRLVAVEDENQQLRERDIEAAAAKPLNGGGAAETIQLRMQMAELNRQKKQLNEHITMISAENRKLWSRLSQISKEQEKGVGLNGADGDATLIQEATDGQPPLSPRSSANQNLIRSKTFTQHSPNPNLRHKLIASDTNGADLCDISLEEEEGLEAYQEDKQMAGGAGEEYAEASEAELAFAYLNVDGGAEGGGQDGEAEFNVEAKKCIDGLQEIKQEAAKQQEVLNKALASLEKKIAAKPCPMCLVRGLKPEMADKSLETDDSLNESHEIQFYENNQLMQQYADKAPRDQLATIAGVLGHMKPLNIVEEKVQADAVDKICPMCGSVFSSNVTFDSFKDHVEMHFIDDSIDLDANVERNYEFVSHTVGDF